MKKITVLGAGNGGQTLAAHLKQKGHIVKLYEHPDFATNIDIINQKKCIELYGCITAKAKPDIATTDIKIALEGSEIVYLVVPSFAHMPMIKLGKEFFEKNSIVVLIPGNFGSLEAFNEMGQIAGKKNITFCETDTMPYACRMDEPGRVNVWGIKKGLNIAALPGGKTKSCIQSLQDAFPIPLQPGLNVLSMGTGNLNMIAHCGTMLLNAGHIEATNGDFRFYTDGVTESVGAVIDEIDKERLAVAKAFDLGLDDALTQYKTSYPVHDDKLYLALKNNPVYAAHGKDAPKTLKHRYVREDVPYLLTPVSELGKVAAVKTPVIDSIILLLSVINSEDYRSGGRNLSILGLDNMDVKGIKSFIGSSEKYREP